MNPECLIILALAIAAVLLYFLTDIFDPIDPFDDDDDNINATAADRSGSSLSSQPSLAPSMRASMQPVEPTTSPVTSAPTKPKLWVRQSGPFTGSQNGGLFGQSVIFVGDYIVVGEPLAGISGDITLLRRSGNGWATETFPFSPSVSQFGYSLAGNVVEGNPRIIVGAIDTNTGNGQFGSAHVYERGSSGWTEIGDILQPALVSAESLQSRFGNSVGIAKDVDRVVTGAPFANTGGSTNNGRVYTFDLTGNSWESIGSTLAGSEPGYLLGSSVDISDDGNWLIAGAPGSQSNNGGIFLYEWTNSGWDMYVPVPGSSGSELGSSVRFISDDGKTFAFGAPSFGNDQGAVRVYQESPVIPGFYLWLGNRNIEGQVGERIGTTVCGAQARVGFGTDLGGFRVYDFVGNTWKEVSTGPDDLGSKVVSMDMSKDAMKVVVGLENEQVLVYELS